MWKERIIYLFVALLVVAIAMVSYLFFETYLEIKREKQTNETSKESNIPAGTEIPLNKEADSNPLPIVTDPDGLQVPIEYPKVGGAPSSGDSNSQPGSDFMNISQWKKYANKKYDYSFSYPKEYDYSPCDDNSPCKYGQVFEKDGGDAAWLNGATNNQGWPYIIITHYNNENYTLPDKVKFFDWLQQRMGWTKDKGPKDFNFEIATSKGDPKKAMRVSVPQSPQAYARDEIYFEDNGKIFQIQLLDSNKAPAQEFYNVWLKTFRLE